ncbi:pyridoxal-phosphate dependent enzyme [Lysinibacillus sp. NPDC059133]|uniref:pyridoxal-phosphate dependent enzyme n=1 Tax=Lysinibacillus sp. NPDC059133 TaxID=3346737 RepID=UPI00369C3CCF
MRLNGLDQFLGCHVYIKAENMQKTNSFKLRGALNKMLSMPLEQLQQGVVVSSGNHGKGVAYAAKLLNSKATKFST